MKKHLKKMLVFGILGGFLLLIVVGYVSSEDPGAFSPEDITPLWHDFRKNYIELSTGRTVSNDATDSTTSEDQAFTLLRAVWMNDQATFDRAWAWTKTYLQHKDDHLFASRYGERADGSYGVDSSPDGQHSSSGADVDMALAHLFAYARWGQPAYQITARMIIDDIWRHEVIYARGLPYLAAGSLEETKSVDRFIVNPSGLPTYALRIFAGLDRAHDWNAVLETSYNVIQGSTLSQLDKKRTARIPPDYILIDRTTGDISGQGMPPEFTTNFGAQAVRIPWRLYLDWLWYRDERAKTALTNMELLGEQWRMHQKLSESYAHDGEIVSPTENTAHYAGSLGYYLMVDRSAAEKIRNAKLVSAYDTRKQVWKPETSASTATWVWLALALSEDILDNLLPPASVNQVHDQFIRETPPVTPELSSTSFSRTPAPTPERR